MFLFHDESPLTFQGPLPEAVDVAIIGGGVIGVSTAWFLLQQGVSVLICDKGRVAGEQSSRNWGWVRITARDPDEVPIAIDSGECWQAIANEIDDDTGFTQQGLLLLASTEAEMAECEEWAGFAKQVGFESRLLGKEDVAKHIDVPGDSWLGGIYSPADRRAEPFKAVPAIARGVKARGGVIRENCAVRTLDFEGGRVSGIVTEAGRVRAGSVICAAGAWSTLFLSNIGVRLPQLAVRGTVARTAEAPEVFGGEAGLTDVYIRRRQDGGYTVASGFTEHTIGANSFRFFVPFTPARRNASEVGVRLGSDVTQQSFPARKWGAEEISPFERHRVLNPAPSAKDLETIRTNLDKRVPQLAGVPFAETWAGMIDATPDVVPVMDAVAAHPGLYIATGFSGHGFGIGPGAGQVMANLVTGQPVRHDLGRFRFSRFSDGSAIRPGPAI